MTRYVMVIDTRTCIGCGDCVVACKTENHIPEGLNRDWVVEATKGTYPDLTTEFRSERCNHCSNPTCVYACPTGASHLWGDTNIVLVDANKCTGCKACIAACPYDARLVMRAEGYIDKCTFCHHRVEVGQDPACVSACPTHCMHFGVLDDPNSEVSRLLATRPHKALLEESGNQPNVFYLT
ncbi:MAG: 4Fe-4S dicluster domain-containing protein [Rubrimonas sp.]|uniref:4Fe-4S dicluster domain-containing protein n=1 Tax=Rubrimonas sp. TaxID=2036015 RepID=UPI002FDD8787